MTYANNGTKLSYLLTLYSQKRLPCNFSLKYPYIIQQTVEENIQTHQVRFITLIEHLTLVINLQGNVQQLEGRIDNQILGVKGIRRDIFSSLEKKYTFGKGRSISFYTNLLQLPVLCKQEVRPKENKAKMKCSNLQNYFKNRRFLVNGY